MTAMEEEVQLRAEGEDEFPDGKKAWSVSVIAAVSETVPAFGIFRKSNGSFIFPPRHSRDPQGKSHHQEGERIWRLGMRRSVTVGVCIN